MMMFERRVETRYAVFDGIVTDEEVRLWAEPDDPDREAARIMRHDRVMFDLEDATARADGLAVAFDGCVVVGFEGGEGAIRSLARAESTVITLSAN